jgi:hypothetical protein
MSPVKRFGLEYAGGCAGLVGNPHAAKLSTHPASSGPPRVVCQGCCHNHGETTSGNFHVLWKEVLTLEPA